jgi:uncharacterized membrane protein
VKNRDRPSFRDVLVGLAVVCYVLILHYASKLPTSEGKLSAAIALLPYLMLAIALAWRSHHRTAWLLVCAGLATLSWQYLDAIGDHAAWMYLAQHAGGNAIMAVVFGISLAAGRVPLCSRIAGLIHGPLDARLARYTRQATQAWTIYFVCITCASILLFACAPIALWSVFANLLSVPLIALMFVSEYLVRLRMLPDIKHVSVFHGIRLYFRSIRASPPPIA